MASAHDPLLAQQVVPAPLRKITLENVIAGATCSPIGCVHLRYFVALES
jgi:hypothetical protein